MTFLDSKWFGYGEKIFNILLLNFLMMLMSMMVITSFNGFSAGYQTLKDMRENQDLSVIKVYFNNFKKTFLKGLIVNILFVLWISSIGVMGKWVIESNGLIKILYVLLSIEILMTLIASSTQLKKKVFFITLLQYGFIHFHVNWYRYIVLFSVTMVCLMIILISGFLIPFSCVILLYVNQVTFEFLTRNDEGDIPMRFLKVFEKTI